ncbi:MAG: tRNA (adenosine(37)-N6)-dimethylallyltransferase MiaA [Dehalococcoidales bacterium]|nr:tRNA (adenosine(37)-N6)-dimethylallyltransferase MiaA [Dehalococcoidales bacterium]
MNKLIAIIGPTGIGKTSLALDLAKKYRGEIVNADSRQVYRYMDIGTAKPSPAELKSVPHHLIDIINPDDDFSLAEYQKLAYQSINDIQSRGKIPLLVGGSGQYIWATIEGWVIPAVSPDMAFRRKLEQKAAEGKADELYRELTLVDPVAAAKIDSRNVRRVIRALEVNRQGKDTFSSLRRKQSPLFDVQIIGLTTSRKTLYARVDARVDVMFTAGFVDEVKGLISRGYALDLPAMSSIGYREIGQYLNGKMTLEEAIYRIKVGTHRFIRQQYTWFRLEDERIHWFDMEQSRFSEIEQLVAEWIKD